MLTALISINALYIGTIEPELVPFDSLTQVEQNQFHAYIKEGHQALKFGDLQGAVINFNDAFVIHQSHDDIIRAQKIIMSILNKNLVKANEKEKAFIQQQIDSLKEYPMFSEKTMINDTK